MLYDIKLYYTLWICWHRISTAGRKTSVLKICRWSLRIHRSLQHQIWPLVIRSKREVCDGWQLQDNNEDEDEDGNEDHVHEGGDEDDEYWEIEEDEDDEDISYHGMTMMMMMMGIMITLMTLCSWTLGNRGTFFLVVLSSDPAVVYMWLILLVLRHGHPFLQRDDHSCYWKSCRQKNMFIVCAYECQWSVGGLRVLHTFRDRFLLGCSYVRICLRLKPHM